MGDTVGCLACDLHSGRLDLPGGVIHRTPTWNVSHCVGPLGVGTLIVTPRRHVVHVFDLDEQELAELGPLLGKACSVVRDLCNPQQVYVCLWSHEGGVPGHIHFVVQPVGDPGPDGHLGPSLQVAMFRQGALPDRAEVEAFAEKARARFS